MIIKSSVKIKNYKCFGEEAQGFERILPINIIIGKNNSGKSSLIDLIEYVYVRNEKLIKDDSNHAKCIAEITIDDNFLGKVGELYSQNSNVGGTSESWVLAAKEHFNQHIQKKTIKVELKPEMDAECLLSKEFGGSFLSSFVNASDFYFTKREFRRINAERDITSELFSPRNNFSEQGVGATNVVWKLLTIKGANQNLIKKEFLIAINKIINPDIEFVDIIIKEDNQEERKNAKGEIFFEIKNGSWVALSKMGSGIKTIILTLLNLLVIPSIHQKSKSKYIFGFEELENNLHPSLLRRLFNFIIEYSKTNKSYFFITTHSSIVIDLFSSYKSAQIIHVENNGNTSVCKTLNSDLDGRNVLKDLDCRPSDLLLSNGIIWVEGPSDAIYFELLIDLYKKEFPNISKLNFCIQSLSTAIWKYAGFTDFDWSKITSIENQVISLAKINHNHVLIIDKDDNYDNDKPSNWINFKHGTGKNKARLINESLKFANHDEGALLSNYGDSEDGKLFFWINDGTFETYLDYFINSKGTNFKKYFSPKKANKYFEKKRIGKDSSKSKVELAAEIAQFSLNAELSIYDIAPKDSTLFEKIERLIETIKSWN